MVQLNQSSDMPPALMPRMGAFSGILWLALAIIGMVVFYWIGLQSLFDAWEKPEYSHGYLIPVIAAGLFLRQMSLTPPAPMENVKRWPGVLMVMLGLVIGFLGNLVNIADISTYGAIIAIAGLVLLLNGVRQGMKYWVPVVYLVFMLPLPNFIYWPLSIKLQMISSEIGVGLITLLGVPVFLEGNVIDLGVYKLQVAEACSGLRYLFPLTSFGFLFAVLYRGPVWHKIIIFLSAAPITVLMNSLRIGIIGVLVDSYGIEQAEGFLHSFQGWVIFIACIAVLYFEAWILQRLVANPKPFHAILDVDFGDMGSQLARFKNILPIRALVGTAVMVMVAGLTWQAVPTQASVVAPRETLALFPTEMNGWKGHGQVLSPAIEQVLAADDYLLADYVNPDRAAPVNFFIAFYKSQTEGSGIHSPEVCIPGGGWEISEIKPKEVRLAGENGAVFNVNQAIIQKGTAKQLVYYWFEQRGRRLTSDYAAKAYTVLDTIQLGRSDGALVRVITPILPSESEELAAKRLNDFLSVGFPEMNKFVPI